MRRLAGLLFVGLFVCGAATAQERLTVRVWNYAGLDAEVLARAEERVAYVFRPARVEIRWLDCDPGKARDAECAAIPTAADLVLRIQGRSTLQGRLGSDVLGRAFGDGIADVYDAEVRQAARSQGLPLADAYTMAITHEFGHLLLGPGAHSTGGLMRPRWEPADLRAVSKGELRLSRDQIARIHAAVASRTAMRAAR